MNKRITSLLFCLTMAVVMMLSAFTVSATEAPITEAATTFNSAFTVTADKTTASPGDEITVTLSLKADSGLTAFQAELSLPDGLTYVDKSGKVDATAKSTLTDSDKFYEWYGEEDVALTVTWTNSSRRLVAISGGYPYADAFDMAVLTFKVKVDDDAAAGSELTVTFTDLETNCMKKNETTGYYDISDYTPAITPVTITVADASVPATSISLNKTTTSIKEQQTETLVATVSPSNSTDKVVWTSGDTTIATVDESGKVTAVKYGSTTITATAGDVSATCTVNVECIHGAGDDYPAEESTCTKQGHDKYTVCGGCGKMLDADGNIIEEIPYRALKDHDFTEEKAAVKYLMTAGDCESEAVYYYSCSVCGVSEANKNHTFKGSKNPLKHVDKDPVLKNATVADHKNGVDGYTGDKYCAGCNSLLEEGEVIPAGAHVPGDDWKYDTTDHWKECTVTGCGNIITDTKQNHSSTGDNVATCQHAAVCDVCGCTYGTVASHDYTDEVKSADALKYEATCTSAAVYYYSCTVCGAVEEDDTHTFLGDIAEHSYGKTYSYNEESHYYECTVCGESSTMQAHTFVWKTDKQATATEKGRKHEECSVCGYAKAGVDIDPIAPATTTAPVTTVPVTTAPVTTTPVTTAPVTTAPVTTAPVTTAPVTTAPVTTAPVTTAPVTTAPVTTAPTTEAPVTTAPETGDVPETDAPKTGSTVAIAAVLVAVSGAAVYVIGSKRKKEN